MVESLVRSAKIVFSNKMKKEVLSALSNATRGIMLAGKRTAEASIRKLFSRKIMNSVSHGSAYSCVLPRKLIPRVGTLHLYFPDGRLLIPSSIRIELEEAYKLALIDVQFVYYIETSREGEKFVVQAEWKKNHPQERWCVLSKESTPYDPDCYQGEEAIFWYWYGGNLPKGSSEYFSEGFINKPTIAWRSGAKQRIGGNLLVKPPLSSSLEEMEKLKDLIAQWEEGMKSRYKELMKNKVRESSPMKKRFAEVDCTHQVIRQYLRLLKGPLSVGGALEQFEDYEAQYFERKVTFFCTQDFNVLNELPQILCEFINGVLNNQFSESSVRLKASQKLVSAFHDFRRPKLSFLEKMLGIEKNLSSFLSALEICFEGDSSESLAIAFRSVKTNFKYQAIELYEIVSEEEKVFSALQDAFLRLHESLEIWKGTIASVIKKVEENFLPQEFLENLLKKYHEASLCLAGMKQRMGSVSHNTFLQLAKKINESVVAYGIEKEVAQYSMYSAKLSTLRSMPSGGDNGDIAPSAHGLMGWTIPYKNKAWENFQICYRIDVCLKKIFHEKAHCFPGQLLLNTITHKNLQIAEKIKGVKKVKDFGEILVRAIRATNEDKRPSIIPVLLKEDHWVTVIVKYNKEKLELICIDPLGNGASDQHDINVSSENFSTLNDRLKNFISLMQILVPAQYKLEIVVTGRVQLKNINYSEILVMANAESVIDKNSVEIYNCTDIIERKNKFDAIPLPLNLTERMVASEDSPATKFHFNMSSFFGVQSQPTSTASSSIASKSSAYGI